jgi:archaellum biogenesis protein FlaJ (TadC family)
LLTLLLKLSGKIPRRVESKLGGLKSSLAKATNKISFEVYLGLLAFTSIVAGIAILTFSLVITVSSFPLLQSVGIAFLFGFFAFFLSVGAYYLYPLLTISSRARKIDANLPLIANFIAVLASSGMPPERIFRSLGNVGDEFGVGGEVRRAIGDVELMGADLNEALKNASKRSASKKFASMLDGTVTTSNMGGDLAGFLRDESDKYKKGRMVTMKSFLENLSGIAEVYVSMMIALPLALVVMLSVMSFIGGGASMFGSMDPQTLLMVLTFLVTPAGVGILLLMVDSMTPPR